MSKPKIVRLFGKADNLEVEFTKCKDGWWECNVPPDYADGQYAATFCAVNEYGETAYWTGELFMCNGVCHVSFCDEKYRIWFKPDRYKFEINQRVAIHIRKGCPHERNRILCR